MSSRYDSSKKLLLTFNSDTFYMISDVITYIHDYFERQARIALYVDMVKSTHPIAESDSKHN